MLPLAIVGCDPSSEVLPFRIQPQRPVEQLEVEALAATPPVEQGQRLRPDLVDLSLLDSELRFDISYAGSNNFMGTPFYRQAKAYLQRPVAEALVAAHKDLQQQGFGLMIFDAYRPWYVTWMFWEGTPENLRQFVADPASGSRHNRGATVDLTLITWNRAGRLRWEAGTTNSLSDLTPITRGRPLRSGTTGIASQERWKSRDSPSTLTDGGISTTETGRSIRS